MSRTLEQQFSHANCCLIRTNTSKLQYRRDHDGRTDGYLFSNENIDKFRAMSKTFSKFIRKRYPEVKLVKDISTEMAQAWIDSNRNNWSDATMNERISQLKMLFLRVSTVYHCEVACDPLKLVLPPGNGRKKRSVMITCEHIIMLRDSFAARDARCAARTALELAIRFGLRVKESAHLHTGNINIERRYIFVREGAKGGKRRYVPIREKDLAFAKELKEKVKHQEYVLGGVTRDAINKGIRREMQVLGIDKHYPDTTNHSIRKYYAVERFNEEIAKGKDEISAWETVQRELGHGDKFRTPLYRAYIAEPMENQGKRESRALADMFDKIDWDEIEE